jgi:hypothetical protein
MSKRRPKSFQSCPGVVGDSVMVMDAQIEITYHMETNRPTLTADEAELVLGYLRDDILQSLINVHCPKPGARNRERPVGSMASDSSASGLEALSIHASDPRWQDSDCAMTHADTLSCHTYSNDVLMLFDSDTTKEQLEADVSETIEEYMKYSFYTNQVNLRLAEEGSSLQVTAFQFQNAQDQPPGPSETQVEPPANSETLQSSSLNVASAVGQEQSAGSGGTNNENQANANANALTVFFGVLAGFLFVILVFVVRKRYLPLSGQTSKSSPIKNGSVKSGSVNGTLLTRDETLIEGDEDEDEEDGSTEGYSLANSDGYQPTCLETDSELVHYIEVGREGEIVKEFKPKNELPIDAILGDLKKASSKADDEARAPMKSHKCSNTRCKSCSKAPDDDPNYLCPNYQTPWGQAGHQSEQEVSLRVFEEEHRHHDTTEDSVSRDSFSVIPPSRVNQVRSQPILRSILSSYCGMGDHNSLLASASDEAAAEMSTIEKITVVSPGRDPPYIQRTLRPDRTVQL